MDKTDKPKYMGVWNALKGVCLIGFTLLLISMFMGCSSNTDIQPQKVTFVTVPVAPASYNVYVFSKKKLIHYDLTEYWYDHDDYDYFADSLPSEGEYRFAEYPLNDGEWDSIVKAIKDNGFAELPEDMNYAEIMDIGWNSIEVKADDERYISGGWGAGWGSTRVQEKYSKVVAVIETIIEKCGDKN